MSRVPFVLLLASVVSSGSWASPRAAVSQEAKVSRVTIPQSAGPPGGSVAVPVQIAAAEGVPIASLTLTLRFPAGQLTFDRVEIGGLGEGVGATATAKTAASGTQAQVDVTIATPDKGGARAPLPDGPVAQLMFTVATGIDAETVIPLSARASGVAAADGKPVDISAIDGEIIVSNPSVIGCFFYMH